MFHPKISQFSYADGRKKLIVGSGNLTPGGLMRNFEGYSVIGGGRRDTPDLSSLDDFLSRHAVDIRAIDQEALDRSALNVMRPIVGVPRPRAPATPATTRIPAVRQAAAAALDRILIAHVPAAGGRWSQVHFNGDIIHQFFRVTDLAVQRVYLTRIEEAGVRGDEEVRPVVYSHANKNHKIEIAAAKGLDYPDAGHPILVFRERQLRCFDYMLLMPGVPGYTEVARLSEFLPTIGRGMRRAITDTATLALAWPASPMMTAAVTAPMEL